ncbi:MAG: phosphatase PAP2 family protein [Lachnospiraceae bacterium]|nr:phosphatase PAP2 family protein [Lachnospiraceae bacterium]
MEKAKETNGFKKNLIITAVLFAVFVIYTLCVKNVDVAAVGPEGSSVGFSSLNSAVANVFGYNEFFYDCSKIIALFSFILIGVIFLTALCQVIKRKGIFKADQDCYVMGVLYGLTGLMYVFFEIVIINYRPVILDEGLEASFPSSHTMLAISVLITGSMWIRRRVDEKKAGLITCFLYTLAVFMVVARLISGVHWLTDIIGAIIAGSFLVSVFMTLMSVLQSKTDQGKD